MSGLPPKADMHRQVPHVRLEPDTALASPLVVA